MDINKTKKKTTNTERERDSDGILLLKHTLCNHIINKTDLSYHLCVHLSMTSLSDH